MATLVLTAVGTALGGPIGGLIGAAAGQVIDGRWLTPGGRRGPRLSDLRVQTSSYGTAIPRLYGRMRVAGTVIWATDLIEQRQRRSAGKGQPKVTTYSYSASFAVALSSRAIVSVHRIWADGNILRGQDGAFVEQTGFRVHHGTEGQPVDPLIAAAEGQDAAPAYRGIAYVVFEDMDLSPYGNRIPSLTFEVEADTHPITLVDPAADILPLSASSDGPEITGYALLGASRREAVSPPAALLPLSRSIAGGWEILQADGPAQALPPPSSIAGTKVPEWRKGAVDRLARDISLSHFDPQRDFQASVQTALVPGGGGAGATLDLPLAANAGSGRVIVEREAARARAAQTSATWPGGLAAIAIMPGVLVFADGARMRVRERRIEGGVAQLLLTGVESAAPTALLADGGRAVTSPDRPTGDTIAALFDLPALVPGDVDQNRLALAASGTGRGWRHANVTLVPAEGAADHAIGTVQAVAVLGIVTARSGGGTIGLFDDASWIEVTLTRDDMMLSNAEDIDLLAGANAAMVGGEVIQFGHAASLGARRWRLTRLLRGRHGSALDAAIGAPFVLLDDPALRPIGDPGVQPQSGGSVAIAATGAAGPITLPITAVGRAQQPLSPVHLRCAWQSDGGMTLSWTRRSRMGFDWRDHVDAPLDAAAEAYRLQLTAGATTLNAETMIASWVVSAADIALWRSTGVTALTVSVAQIGALAVSAAYERTFPL
jgi:hypothetical protein